MKIRVIAFFLTFSSLPAIASTLVFYSVSVFGSCLSTLFNHPETLKELARLRVVLDRSYPTDVLPMRLEEEYARKKHEFISVLEKELNLSELDFQKMLRNEIEALQNAEEGRARQQDQQESMESKVLANFAIDGMRGVFHPIKASAFVEYPFQMMATHTTQIIWKKIVQLARKTYPGEYDELKENPSHFIGDTLPVESVSANEVLLWLQALNRLSEDGAPELSAVMVNHRPFDDYRLPTVEEWSYVGRLLLIPNLSVEERLRLFWTTEDSERMTHAVGTKPALIFENKEFDSYMGNVATLTSSPRKPESLHVRGEDYLSLLKSRDFFDSISSLTLDCPSKVVGFRMVRTSGGRR